MVSGGGMPGGKLKAPSPGSAARHPSRKNSGWRGGRKGQGGRFRGALTPHTMPYRVITECAFRCHAGPGPPVSRVGIPRPPRPFSACGPSPSSVPWVILGSLAAGSPEPQAGGSALCWLFERLSRVILKEFLMRCIEKTLYTNGRIVTMDAAGTVAEAVLVAGNVIEAVGSKDGLAALAGPAAGPLTSRARPSTLASSTRTATPRCTPCGKRTAAVRASRTLRTCIP